MENNNTNNLSLRSILEKDKLNGTNFVDWKYNLSIALHIDEKEYVLEKPIPPTPLANAPKVVKDAYEKYVKDENQVSCVMLATMTAELQKQHDYMKAHDMTMALREPVGPHVLKRIGYITNMEKLGFTLQKELATDLILQSLSKLYKEENLTKGKSASVLMVQGGKGKPKKGIKIKARTIGKPKLKSTSFATQKPVGGLQRANVITVCDKCFLMGYPKEIQGYSFYHPIHKKVFVARNGVFIEKEFLSNATSGRKIELEEIRDNEETNAPVQEHELEEQTIVLQNAQDTQEPRRSNRLRTHYERYGFILTFEGDVMLIDQDEPKTYLEAISCPEAEEWRQAMQSEMDSIKAEYIVAADEAKECGSRIMLLSLEWLLASIKNPIPLFCNNNGAIAEAKEPWSHCKDDNIADPLTKALGKPKQESHTWSMGVREMLDWP
ncbi:unnamed protein product [Cuscuta campestris]|uniref:Retroviral polymerase SH3-like domain-containing protein n=1 Tax=Cuscuta campestris TaxID=132261 RepID=A0A484MPQ8_9ASTE|nr:unnamed protein product [Cuscuta campestris]VFQ90750.1 unnamed protein product [Cuscuta campestris]